MLNCVIHFLCNFFRAEVFKIIQLQHSAHFRVWHRIDCSICMCNQLGKIILLKIQLPLLCIFPLHKEHKTGLWTSCMSTCFAKRTAPRTGHGVIQILNILFQILYMLLLFSDLLQILFCTSHRIFPFCHYWLLLYFPLLHQGLPVRGVLEH
nr:MAG TPA: hypothetical protein [Caudoviricetes sp.]